MSVFERQIKTERVKYRKNVHYYHGGGHMPSLEMRHISCLLRVSLLSEMGQRAQIFISETL